MRRIVACYGLPLDDLWNEAVALMRANCYLDGAKGAVIPYGQTAVHRALWTRVVRGHLRRSRHETPMALEDVGDCWQLTGPSAGDAAIVQDAARQAWILAEHAPVAQARGGADTTTCLRAAATGATVANSPRRRPTARPGTSPPSPTSSSSPT